MDNSIQYILSILVRLQALRPFHSEYDPYEHILSSA